MVDSVLEVQNIKLPDSGGVTSSTAITLDASGNTTATLSSSSNIKAPLNASGDAPVYACRAWVNFDGTFATSPFTVANGGIRASGNVSSITDNGTGDYTVNFTTAMPDGDYSVAGSVGGSTSSRPIFKTPKGSGSFNVNDFSLEVLNESTGNVFDTAYICLSVFR